jgi:hypothetical protein
MLLNLGPTKQALKPNSGNTSIDDKKIQSPFQMGNGVGSCVWVIVVSAPTSQWERGLRYMSSIAPTRSSCAPECKRTCVDTLLPALYPALPIPPSFPSRGCPNSWFRSSFISPCITLCPSLPRKASTWAGSGEQGFHLQIIWNSGDHGKADLLPWIINVWTFIKYWR